MLRQLFVKDPLAALKGRDDILAIIPLGVDCSSTRDDVLGTGLDSPVGAELTEIWLTSDKVVRGSLNNCFWSKSSDVICVSHWISASDFNDVENSVKDAYEALFSVAIFHGFPHVFRCWNYMERINEGQGDSEIYKRFCVGRLAAFKSLNMASDSFPAASALGHKRKGAVIYLFASKSSPICYSNSMQVDAYRYPRQYGKSSPSFARASALSLEGENLLFISGTASIKGHETVGGDCLPTQLKVTGDNIEHLLVTCNPHGLRPRAFKVYIRNQADFGLVRDWLFERFPHAEAMITCADICRKDLLVEIECFCN